MVRVRLHASWRDDQSLRELLSRQMQKKYYWNDIEFVTDDSFDYLVIFNFPRKSFNIEPKKIIIFQGEPEFVRKNWGNFYKPNPDIFLKVFDTNEYYSFPRWSINKDYNWLLNNSIEKSKIISAVVSNLSSTDKHKSRLNFVENYLHKIKGFDHYGRGVKSLENKEDGLFKYKYTFQSENTYEKGYFTEKLLDSIISECLCFYDGCPNLEDFIDPDCFIRVDTNKPEESYEIINDSINNNEWEKRIEKIRSEKKRILEEFQVFPLIEKTIKNNI